MRPWTVRPLVRDVARAVFKRARLDERVRAGAAACRNVRIGPAEARRQLVAQLERQRLEDGVAPGVEEEGERERLPVVGSTGGEHASDSQLTADGVARTLRLVTSALEAAKAPYVIVPPDPARPCRVAVPERFRRRSLRPLRGLGDTVWLSPDGQDTSSRHRRAARRLGHRALRVLPWRAERRNGDGLEGPVVGCQVEFWPLDRALPDRLWWWRWNGTREAPSHGPASVDEINIGDRSYPAVRSIAAEPRVDEVTFPVDVVYTWVDGADPEWMAWKKAVLQDIDAARCTVDADDPSRYHSYDELRYSLRSVATFTDFVRHIFVVTDSQVPPWLNTDHERITVVDHREIFTDEDCLPTFNSHAIESRLHHIKGLAEHYLYLNDDFFFGRPVAPEQFFHANGATKFFPSPAPIPSAGPSCTELAVDAAAQNTRRLVHERFGRLVCQKIKHAPYPQRRSVLFEMEETLREEFKRTAASRVRSPEDVPVPSSLFHYYAYLTGRAVPGRISSRYVSLGEPDLRRRLRRLRRRRDFDVLCINDSVDAHADDLGRRGHLLERFMESYWPTKSPFER